MGTALSFGDRSGTVPSSLSVTMFLPFSVRKFLYNSLIKTVRSCVCMFVCIVPYMSMHMDVSIHKEDVSICPYSYMFIHMQACVCFSE